MACQAVLVNIISFLVLGYLGYQFIDPQELQKINNLPILGVLFLGIIMYLYFNQRKKNPLLNSESFDVYLEGNPVTTNVIKPNPRIRIDVQPTTEEILPGKVITYNLKIQNTGNVELKHLVMVNRVPDHTFYYTSDDGLYRHGYVSWGHIDLTPGQTVTKSFSVKVDPKLDAFYYDQIQNNIYFVYTEI